MSVLVLLLYLTGTLGSSAALVGRADSDDPLQALEAAARAVADSPTSGCLNTCQFVGAEKTIKSCEDKTPLFDILVTGCLCDSILDKLHDCAACMDLDTKPSANSCWLGFSDICFNYGFTSENGTALVDEPNFPYPKIVLLSPLALTQCEHAVYVWASPYFITSVFDLTFTPFNPANSSLPAEITGAGSGFSVVNYTFLVDYPANTQITLNVTGGGSTAISTSLTVLNSADTSWTDATTGGAPASRGQWTLMTALLTLGIGVTLS
ncbi:hypothetical protein GGX14DRAFT_467454 [Mycena pura]|uniref:Extracellular membrane protein CFEM domain-containing protein n=1 Tax=Mycena pura TaxID=153505 RepID=A0AAD6V0L2_9AGAR|nr:hypothetical protein GGX14DRAFT_467454 [Mycena pura]